MKARLVALVIGSTLVTVGCAHQTPMPTVSGRSPIVAVDRVSEAIVDNFIQAANEGDVASLREVFSSEARFDRAGTIFRGEEIIVDFLKPDVVDMGGHYTETGRHIEGGRVIVAFDFDAGAGGSEYFTYNFLVQDEQIVDVIGRYREPDSR